MAPFLVEMAKIVCCNCNHEMFLAGIYNQDYYMTLVCSECNNLYLTPKQTAETLSAEIIQESNEMER